MSLFDDYDDDCHDDCHNDCQKNGCHSCCHCNCKRCKWEHKKCHSTKHCKPKKSCRESLNELLSSAADIEGSLAKAISSESELLKKENISAEDLSVFTDKLENVIKLAIKKEVILEFLIEDAIKACDIEKHNKGTKKKRHKA